MDDDLTMLAIVNAAKREFFAKGYHHFSASACAKIARVSMATYEKFAPNKKALALTVLEKISARAANAIINEQDIFGLHEGPALVLLPMKLYDSGDAELIAAVNAYYQQWKNVFYGKRIPADIKKSAEFFRGHMWYWAWLGFWMIRQGE